MTETTADPAVPAPDVPGADPDAPAADAVDLEQIAAEFDAQALADAGGAPDPDDPDAPAPDPNAPPAATPRGVATALKTFIDKNYGGNEDAFVASLYENRAEQKRLSDEIAVLKAGGVPKPADPAISFKTARDADSEIQGVEQEIAQTQAENKAIATRLIALANEANKIEKAIDQLDAEIPHLEEPKEIAKKQNEISRKRTELNSLVSEFNTKEALQRTNMRDISRMQRELQRAERDLRGRLDAEEREKEQEASDSQRTVQLYDAAFEHLVKPYGVDPASGRYRYMHSATKAQLASHLESLGENARGMDATAIFKATAELIAAYAENHNMKPKAPGTPSVTPKRPVTPRPIITPRAAAPKPKSAGGVVATPDPNAPAPRTLRTPDDVLSDPALVRQRARAIATASARAQSGALRRGLA